MAHKLWLGIQVSNSTYNPIRPRVSELQWVQWSVIWSSNLEAYCRLTGLAWIIQIFSVWIWKLRVKAHKAPRGPRLHSQKKTRNSPSLLLCAPHPVWSVAPLFVVLLAATLCAVSRWLRINHLQQRIWSFPPSDISKSLAGLSLEP